MKIINTLSYIRKKTAQLALDEQQAYDIIENDDEIDSIPEISQADLENLLEDSFEEDNNHIQDEGLKNKPYYINDNYISEFPNVEREEINFDALEDVMNDGGEVNDENNPINIIKSSEPKGNNIGKVVKIWYETKSGRDIERIIEPHDQFIARSTGNNILVAFDRTVNDIRAYIMQNILWTESVDEEFKRKFKISQN